MLCENVINMLPTIFTCALKYKLASGVLYLGNACVQSCVLIYNISLCAWSGSWLLTTITLLYIQWVCVPLKNKHPNDVLCLLNMMN